MGSKWQIEKIVLHNFGPYVGVNIREFKSDNILLIAEYENEIKRSNRAGKSFFLEAIPFALYGQSRYGKQASKLISHGKDEMQVSIGIKSIDPKTNLDMSYNIIRGVGSSGKAYAKIGDMENGGFVEVEGVTEVNAFIRKNIISLPYEWFMLLFFCNKDTFHNFMDLGPTKSMELIQQISGMDKWTDFYKRSSSLFKKKLEERDQLQEKLNSLEQRLNPWDYEGLFTNLLEFNEEEFKKVLNNNVESLVELTNKIEEIDKEVFDLSKRIPVGMDVDSQIARLEEEKENINITLNNSGSLRIRHTALEQEASEIAGIVDALEMDIGSVRLNFETAKKNKTFVDSKKQVIEFAIKQCKGSTLGFLCPFFDQQCMLDFDIDKLKNKLTKTNEEFVVSTKDVDRINSSLLNLECRRNELKERQTRDKIELEHICKELNSTTDKELYARLNVVLEEIKQLKEEPRTTVLDEEARIDSSIKLQEEKIKLVKNLTTLELNYDMLQIQFKKFNEDKIEYEKLTNKINTFNHLLDNMRYVVNMFSKYGIPSLEMSTVVKELEAELSRSLALLGSNLRVEISTEKELKKLEANCSACGKVFDTKSAKTCVRCGSKRQNEKSNKLTFTFFDENNNKFSFEGESSGGKMLISLAQRAALLAIIDPENTLDFISFDEPFDSLDGPNKQFLIDYFLKDGDSFDVSRRFVISHVNSIAKQFEDVILVQRGEDGFSKIVSWA